MDRPTPVKDQPCAKPTKSKTYCDKGSNKLYTPSSAKPNKQASVSVITGIQRNTILCKLGATNVNCLLDTGAAISCISERFLLKSNVKYIDLGQPDITAVTGVSGQKLGVVKKVTIAVKISNVLIDCDFYVIKDLQQQIILGLDFMQKHNVEIDFRNKTVYIQDKTIETRINQSNSGVAKPLRSVSIPARSQVDIPVFVSRRKSGDIVLLEPVESLTDNQLVGARCLVKISKRKTVVRILNPGDEPVTLVRRKAVATAHDVHVNSIQPLANDSPNPCCASLEKGHMSHDPNLADLEVEIENPDLSDSQKEKLKKVLNANRDVFSTGSHDVGKTNLCKHRIETLPWTGPVKLPAFQQNPITKRITTEEVNKMLENDIIEPSNSMWHSPIVLIKKKDDSYRFCVDFRSLNAITKPISYPLPKLEAVFDAIGEAKA